MESIKNLSIEELCEYLKNQNFQSEVIESVGRNRISGSSFLELTPEHLKELFPAIGDRMSVSKLLNKTKEAKGPSLPLQV